MIYMGGEISVGHFKCNMYRWNYFLIWFQKKCLIQWINHMHAISESKAIPCKYSSKILHKSFSFESRLWTNLNGENPHKK